jgi:hypothetical protein
MQSASSQPSPPSRSTLNPSPLNTPFPNPNTPTPPPPKQVGAALTSSYWHPGNSAMFLDLVHSLTGRPLLADAWVARLQVPIEQLLAREKGDYEAAVKAGPK